MKKIHVSKLDLKDELKERLLEHHPNMSVQYLGSLSAGELFCLYGMDAKDRAEIARAIADLTAVPEGA